MTLRDLVLRVRALVAPRRAEQELDDELAFHVERETHKHIAGGMSAGDARAKALARFGPMPLAADQCRDARGTAFLETLVRDVLYAFRTFRRAPLVALTIVATVALGLGLLTVVFAVYNTFFLRPDAVRSPGELFAVERDQRSSSFTRPPYNAMRRETSVFADACAMASPAARRIEGRVTTTALVTGNFFQVLGVQAALGRPLTPADDERLSGRPVIVLSHEGWIKLFAGDPTAIGRRVVVNRAHAPYEIVGVMPKGFRGLAMTPADFWAPLALAGQFIDTAAGKEDEIVVEVIGRLKPGMSPEAAAAGLTVWASGRTDMPALGAADGKPVPGRSATINLKTQQGALVREDGDLVESLTTFSPIFFAFGLILMIACANVANLLLARGLSRQAEIGTRLSLGASRQRVIRQLLTESLLLALAAAGCGLVVSRLFLDAVLYAVNTTMPPDIAQFASLFNFSTPATDWRVVVFVAAGAVVSTAFFGLAPALQATRLDLVRTMRGEVTRDARPRRARHALIAGQVGASALLLICAAIFLRGALAAATADPGVRTSDTLRLSIYNEPRRAALLRAVTAHPSVAAVAASSRSTRGVVEGGSETSSTVPVSQLAVSSNYFDILGIEIVSGRAFTPAERTAESAVAIVSETIR